MLFPSQTRGLRGFLVFCFCVVCPCAWQPRLPPLAAQPATEALWRQIKAADEGISACQVSWQTVFTHRPRASYDVEKSVARTTEGLRKQGISEAELQKMAPSVREGAQSVESGSKQTMLYDLVRQDGTIRCVIRQSVPVTLDAALPPVDSYTINFYDGKNIVNLEEMRIPAQAQAKQKLPASITGGELRRDGQEILPHFGPDDLSLLAGAPMLSDFSPENSTLREAGGDTLLLERRADVDGPKPRLFRVVLSKRTMRPVTSETVNLVNNGVITRLKFSDYKLCPGSIWFPGKISEEHLSSEGKSVASRSHLLLKAAFNQAADVSILSKPLPVGATINDHRFAPRPSVPFMSKDGAIPADDKILKLVEESEAMTNRIQGREQAQEQSKWLPVTLPFGIALIVGGVWLWRKSNRPAKT